MTTAKNIAREAGAIGLVLVVLAVCFAASFIAVSNLLPLIAPVHGKDLGYPFAVAAVAIILGLGMSVLVLRAIAHLALRKTP